MKKIALVFVVMAIVFSCKETEKKAEEKQLSAQEIIDKSIAVSGGDAFSGSRISFDFRGRTYISEGKSWRSRLERITTDSTGTVRDVLNNSSFSRYINGELTQVPDTMVSRYSNSVNSVHYFAYLPYGLNSKAVNKELLGEISLKEKTYYKVKVTFDEEGGGDDFEDIYLYWIDKDMFTVDYLAYEFGVNGGGMRFREAFNIRTVNGIRFVDYHNFKPEEGTVDFYTIDDLFEKGELELVSEIKLENLSVTPCNEC